MITLFGNRIVKSMSFFATKKTHIYMHTQKKCQMKNGSPYDVQALILSVF